MTTRRRFLTISAGLGLTGVVGLASTRSEASPTEWQGFMMGAEVSIKIYGEKQKAELAIKKAVEAVSNFEKKFSIYDPSSQLSILNKQQFLNPDEDFFALLTAVGEIHLLTDGLFDPTVQPVFEAKGLLSNNINMGWQHVLVSPKQIRFARPKMSMTFNGIAQGFITDRVSEVLKSEGLSDVLVNMGEYRAGEKPMQMGVANIEGDLLAELSLQDNAIATSSSDAFQFENGQKHIITPDLSKSASHWRTVSVVAQTATLADGFSTALSLTKNTQLAKKLKLANHLEKVIFEDYSGKIITI